MTFMANGAIFRRIFSPIIINVYECVCGVGAGLLSSPFVASFHLFA